MTPPTGRSHTGLLAVVALVVLAHGLALDRLAGALSGGDGPVPPPPPLPPPPDDAGDSGFPASGVSSPGGSSPVSAAISCSFSQAPGG